MKAPWQNTTSASLSAETVKFFLAAARYFEAFLNFQLFSLHTDPFIGVSANETALQSTSLAADFSTAHHLAVWLETAFMALDGDNRDNARFMKYFTEALQRQHAGPPIQLKHQQYQDILADNMISMLKPVCNVYLNHLRMQRDNLAVGGKISRQALDQIDEVITHSSTMLAGKRFAEVKPFVFSILETPTGS
jgi:hypothetical protein